MRSRPGYLGSELHRERVVVLAGVSGAMQRPKEDLSDRLMFHTRAGEWLLRVLAAHAPEQLISATLSSEGDLDKELLKERTSEVFADPDKRQFVLDLAGTVTVRGREAGLDNDWIQFRAPSTPTSRPTTATAPPPRSPAPSCCAWRRHPPRLLHPPRVGRRAGPRAGGAARVALRPR